MDRQTLIDRLATSFPAAVTPFDSSGALDHGGLAANLHWWVARGAGGVLLLGSTGELPHLSDFEQALVLEVGRRHLPESHLLLAGCGRDGTHLAVEACTRAANAGVDAALVGTPTYYQGLLKVPRLIEYYRAVADQSPIPVLLYSVPSLTGVTIPPEVVAALAPHPNVVGMKDSSGDARLAAAYRAAASEAQFVMLSGSAYGADAFMLSGLFDGLILGAGNVLPEAAAGVMSAARAGDVSNARHHGDALRAASRGIGRYGIGGWKAGLGARGRFGGAVRSPLPALSGEETTQVIEATIALCTAFGYDQETH